MRANNHGDAAGEVDLLNEDLELLLREINDFCGSNAARSGTCIPKPLEDYLAYVARTGNTVFPWNHVRNLFRLKLELAIDQFPGEPSVLEPSVYERFDLFRSAPFTIQRLSELITEPTRHYKMKEKYMFALEKTVYVVSTVEPFLPTDHANNNGEEVEEHDSAEFSDDNTGLNSSFIQQQGDIPVSGEVLHYEEMESESKETSALSSSVPAVVVTQPDTNFNVAEMTTVEVPVDAVETIETTPTVPPEECHPASNELNVPTTAESIVPDQVNDITELVSHPQPVASTELTGIPLDELPEASETVETQAQDVSELVPVPIEQSAEVDAVGVEKEPEVHTGNDTIELLPVPAATPTSELIEEAPEPEAPVAENPIVEVLAPTEPVAPLPREGMEELKSEAITIQATEEVVVTAASDEIQKMES